MINRRERRVLRVKIDKNMETENLNFPHTELTDKVIKSAIEVHRRLGPGFTEDIYEEAFAYELNIKKNGYDRQWEIKIPYRDIIIHRYRLDFVVEKKVVVELKAVSNLNEIHKAQLLSYLKASELEVGLLLNFNVTRLKDGIKRLVFSKGFKSIKV